MMVTYRYSLNEIFFFNPFFISLSFVIRPGDKMLDKGGFQVPLMYLENRYIENEGSFLRIEFANKADVYEAINLMDAIKRY